MDRSERQGDSEGVMSGQDVDRFLNQRETLHGCISYKFPDPRGSLQGGGSRPNLELLPGGKALKSTQINPQVKIYLINLQVGPCSSSLRRGRFCSLDLTQ